MEKLNRRNFLKKASGITATGGTALLLGCGSPQNDNASAPAVNTGKKFRWKMVTTWPPKFPVVGEGAEMFAKLVDEMSSGRLKIRVYGGGELVPALETFDAVSQGVAEMGHGASYYWRGKAAATPFFCSIPFGMNAQQMNAWILSGGGLALWDELYAPFNLRPFPAGNTGVQMGGWFNRKINSIADIKGLKMRIPGLGGEVITRAGGSAVLSPGGEIFTNLERGVIDATEWIGPYHDYLMGFHKVAKYYYYPGWHEPGSVLELIINKSSYDELPKDLQTIIQVAAQWANVWMLSEFEAKNSIYLQKIIDEQRTQILPFPDDVLSAFRKIADETIEEIISEDPMSKKVYESFRKFQKETESWADITEKAYYLNLSL